MLFRQIIKNRLGRHEIFITLDYATGAFLHEETDNPVAVAVNIGNVSRVYAVLQEIFPKAFIVACLNYDPNKERMHKGIAAKLAASGGIVISPRLSIKERCNGLMSFNDLAMFYDNRGTVLEKIIDLIQYTQEREPSAERGNKFSEKRAAAKPKKKTSKSRKPSACPKE